MDYFNHLPRLSLRPTSSLSLGLNSTPSVLCIWAAKLKRDCRSILTESHQMMVFLNRYSLEGHLWKKSCRWLICSKKSFLKLDKFQVTPKSTPILSSICLNVPWPWWQSLISALDSRESWLILSRSSKKPRIGYLPKNKKPCKRHTELAWPV